MGLSRRREDFRPKFFACSETKHLIVATRKVVRVLAILFQPGLQNWQMLAKKKQPETPILGPAAYAKRKKICPNLVSDSII